MCNFCSTSGTKLNHKNNTEEDVSGACQTHRHDARVCVGGWQDIALQLLRCSECF